MAEKNAKSLGYDDVMSELKKNNYAPVYLLHGDESYYIDKVYEYIVANALKEEEKDFNLTVVYGADVTAHQVMDYARRVPLMADRQVVAIREAQAMKDLDALEKYVAVMAPQTVLVVCHHGKVDGRKRLPGVFATKGVVMLSEPPKRDDQIKSFIEHYVRQPEYNAKIDPRATDIIAAHIGADLKRLASELDKIQLSFVNGEARVVTPELVEQKIGISKSYNVFELKNALIARDALKAHRIAKYFDDNPKAGGLFAVMPFLFSYFQNLMLAYYTTTPVNDSAIMAQLGLKNVYAVNDYKRGMRAFTARQTLNIISKIREIDGQSKGLDNVNTPPGELLKELISYILS